MTTAAPVHEPAGAAIARRTLVDGTVVVSVDMALPMGWNRPFTTVYFVLPVAFPSAQPDCFYADEELRLADGGVPVNSGIQTLDGRSLLWFSWHLATWSPSDDSVDKYLRFIERRLRDVR